MSSGSSELNFLFAFRAAFSRRSILRWYWRLVLGRTALVSKKLWSPAPLSRRSTSPCRLRRRRPAASRGAGCGVESEVEP